MSLRTNRKTAATVTTYFVKVGKAPLRRLFLSIQLLLFPSISIYVCLSLLLLFSKFQPAKHALHRQRDTLDMLFIASYSYVIFFVGQETIGVRSQTFHLHQKHSAFCPCWMSLVRHRWSDGGMWEAGFRAAGAQRLSGWQNGWNKVICLNCSDIISGHIMWHIIITWLHLVLTLKDGAN